MKKIILLSLTSLFCLGAPAQTTTLFENFNNCDSVSTEPGATTGITGYFPPGWYTYSVLGDQVWKCYATYGVSHSPCIQMNDYVTGSGDFQNEDWLITPQLTLSSYAHIYLNFYGLYKFAGDSLHIMVSNNYTGTGNPTSATWHELSHPLTTMFDDTGSYAFKQFQVDLTPYKATPLYVGFKYTSTSSDGSRWTVDSVYTTTTALGGPSSVNNVVTVQTLPLTVLGLSTGSEIKASFNANAGQYVLAVFDLTGRKVYSKNINAENGYQTITIDDARLRSGMYIMKLSDNSIFGITKFIVE